MPTKSFPSVLADFAKQGWLNLAGGCCGSTPEHNAAIAQAVRGFAPRLAPALARDLRLSGLESCGVSSRAP